MVLNTALILTPARCPTIQYNTHYPPGSNVEPKRLPSLQMPAESPGPSVLLIIDGVPTTDPLLRFDNLLGQHTELKKMFHSNYNFIIKDITQQQPD